MKKVKEKKNVTKLKESPRNISLVTKHSKDVKITVSTDRIKINNG